MDDLLAQLKTLRKIGNIGSFIGMIPGLNKIKGQLPNIDNKTFTRHEAIINSMTHKERKDPRILNASRKHRIAKGSGTQVQDINRLVKQYLEMQSFVKKFGSPDGKMLDKIGKILNGR